MYRKEMYRKHTSVTIVGGVNPWMHKQWAAWSKEGNCAGSTLTSPRYTNSSRDSKSSASIPASITTGCWHGVLCKQALCCKFLCYALMLEFRRQDDATFNKSNRNGLAAQRTILCAGKLRPPAAKVTSTKSPCPLNSCTAEAREELNSPQDRL